MKKFFLLLLTVILSSCGPTIRYQYIPPSDDFGKLCVNNCQLMKQLCEKDKSQSLELCAVENRRCREINRLRQESAGVNNRDYYQENCLLDQMSCERRSSQGNCKDDFNICFKNCGGEVVEFIEQ